MGKISTRVDGNGFWYLLDFSDDHKFCFGYVAIGSAGRFASGEIGGSVAKKPGWQRVELGFPVLHVGLTEVEVGIPEDGKGSSGDYSSKKLPSHKRAALMALVSTTLTGGLLLSRAGVALPDLLGTRDGKIVAAAELQDVSGTTEEGSGSAFNPY